MSWKPISQSTDLPALKALKDQYRGFGYQTKLTPGPNVGKKRSWQLHVEKRNPGGRMTKLQRKVKAQKASVERRVASALAKFLKQANPAMKTAGAKLQRLKGGVIKITPIKANAGRGGGTVETLLYNKFRREGYSVAEARRMAKLNAPYYKRGRK